MTDIQPTSQSAIPAVPEPKDQQARVAVVSIVGLTLLGIGLIIAAIIAMVKGQGVEAAAWTVLGAIVGSLATGLNPPGGASYTQGIYVNTKPNCWGI